MRTKLTMCAAALVALVGTEAMANPASRATTKPAYTAADIVSHFAAASDLGAPRALCIGTESECAKSIPKPAQAKGFDLVVRFEYNSDRLTPAAKGNLDEFALALGHESLATSGFVVEGHTDGKGSDQFNFDLSVRRANAVVGYLSGRGVPSGRLEAKGYGKQRLLDADPLSETNRRVETRLRLD